MILLIHIASAITSVIAASWLYFQPSRRKLQASYALTGLMLLTGFYLVLSKPAHMLETCVMGLVYLGGVSYGIVMGRRKLAAVTNK